MTSAFSWQTLCGWFLKYQDWLKTQLFGPVKWASTQFCIKFQSQNCCDVYFKWGSLNRMKCFCLRNISRDLAFPAWMGDGPNKGAKAQWQERVRVKQDLIQVLCLQRFFCKAFNTIHFCQLLEVVLKWFIKNSLHYQLNVYLWTLLSIRNHHFFQTIGNQL